MDRLVVWQSTISFYLANRISWSPEHVPEEVRGPALFPSKKKKVDHKALGISPRRVPSGRAGPRRVLSERAFRTHAPFMRRTEEPHISRRAGDPFLPLPRGVGIN